MYRFFVLLFMFFGWTMQAQQSFNESDALTIIKTFFDGFHQGDTLKMRGLMVKDMPIQTVLDRDGSPVVAVGSGLELLTAVANRKPDQKWNERLLDYHVQMDGNLAHVWTPYEFWLNDKFLHCGANSFTLAKTPDGWKIVHLIDSRRREDCQK